MEITAEFADSDNIQMYTKVNVKSLYMYLMHIPYLFVQNSSVHVIPKIKVFVIFFHQI